MPDPGRILRAAGLQPGPPGPRPGAQGLLPGLPPQAGAAALCPGPPQPGTSRAARPGPPGMRLSGTHRRCRGEPDPGLDPLADYPQRPLQRANPAPGAPGLPGLAGPGQPGAEVVPSLSGPPVQPPEPGLPAPPRPLPLLPGADRPHPPLGRSPALSFFNQYGWPI